jgi:hypothetical protein
VWIGGLRARAGECDAEEGGGGAVGGAVVRISELAFEDVAGQGNESVEAVGGGVLEMLTAALELGKEVWVLSPALQGPGVDLEGGTNGGEGSALEEQIDGGVMAIGERGILERLRS